MMFLRHPLVALLVCAPLAATAQPWTAETFVEASPRESYSHSGNHVGLGTRDAENEWLATEVFVVEPGGSLDCATAVELELDHYYGVDDTYVVHVLMSATRSDDGAWEAYDVNAHFERLGYLDRTLVAYFDDDASAKIQSLTCKGDQAELVMSFSAAAVREVGDGPDMLKVMGNTSVLVQMKSFDDY